MAVESIGSSSAHIFETFHQWYLVIVVAVLACFVSVLYISRKSKVRIQYLLLYILLKPYHHDHSSSRTCNTAMLLIWLNFLVL